MLDKPSLEAAAQKVIDTYGRVDILINGAGGNRPDGLPYQGGAASLSFRKRRCAGCLNLNFIGSVMASQVFGSVIARQEAGVILNVSSMASYQPMTRVVAYSGAKAAINNFTHWLAVYMATEHTPIFA